MKIIKLVKFRQYVIFTQETLKKVIPFCKKNFIIYGMPLAKGLLTGKYNDLTSFRKLT